MPKETQLQQENEEVIDDVQNEIEEETVNEINEVEEVDEITETEENEENKEPIENYSYIGMEVPFSFYRLGHHYLISLIIDAFPRMNLGKRGEYIKIGLINKNDLFEVITREELRILEEDGVVLEYS